MFDSATPWTVAHEASLSFTISQSLLTPMSIESVMPSNHLILCHHLLLLPSIFPSIRVFSWVTGSRIAGSINQLAIWGSAILGVGFLALVRWKWVVTHIISVEPDVTAGGQRSLFVSAASSAGLPGCTHQLWAQVGSAAARVPRAECWGLLGENLVVHGEFCNWPHGFAQVWWTFLVQGNHEGY